MSETKRTCAKPDTVTLAINRPPALTWHRMRINETEIEVPGDGLIRTADVTCEFPVGIRCLDESLAPIGRADAVKGRAASSPREEAAARDARATANDAASAHGLQTLAGDAALAKAFDRALALDGATGAWETGMGEQAAGWLAAAAGRHIVVEVPAGFEASRAAVIRIGAVPDAASVAVIDVVAGTGSHLHLVVETNSPRAGIGQTGSLVRVLAGVGARVEIDELQTLGSTWTWIDDIGIRAADGAHITVNQTILGGAHACMGLACDLSGYRSSCDVDTRYLGHGAARIDLNYIMRQRGARSRATLTANGVLADASEKVLRGTIDLVHGCKGSVGREQETVLLTSETARNKTLPVILCDEDDVQGDHGATIGHVNPAQLAYLRARGLTTAQVETLFVSAAFDNADARAHDAQSHAAISRLAVEVLGEEGADMRATAEVPGEEGERS